MKYDNGSAFRRALEDRLLNQSLQTGMSLTRLRKMIAFDRYLARLIKNQPALWVLKGGLALQLRLGVGARTTKDIDLLLLDAGQDIPAALRLAGAVELGDWFSFEVGNAQMGMDEQGGRRYPIRAFLDSRPFETFHMDIGVGDALVEPPDKLITPELLAFAGFQSTLIPCYPITQQIAEKLHAYTGSYNAGKSSRVKDFVDMILLAGLAEIKANKLRQAMEATFTQRGTHVLPEQLPSPPENWETSFKKLATEVGIEFATLQEAYFALKRFIDPLLLFSPSTEKWDPVTWSWHS